MTLVTQLSSLQRSPSHGRIVFLMSTVLSARISSGQCGRDAYPVAAPVLAVGHPEVYIRSSGDGGGVRVLPTFARSPCSATTRSSSLIRACASIAGGGPRCARLEPMQSPGSDNMRDPCANPRYGRGTSPGRVVYAMFHARRSVSGRLRTSSNAA